MKHRWKLLGTSLITLCSLSFSGNLSAIDPKKFNTNFEAIGPFEQFDDDYEMTGNIIPKTSIPNVKERLSVAVSGYSYSKYITTKGHDVYESVVYQLTFKLPLKTMFGPDGIDCLVEFLDNDYRTIQSFSFSLKPIKKVSIDPHDYLSSYFFIKDTIVDPDNYKNSVGEKFMFDGFIDYFNVDNYYRLDLRNIYLTYSCLKPGLPVEAVLHFDDYDNLFPLLDITGEVSCFEIPLVAEINGDKVNFKIRRTLYVNPSTLEMSLRAKPNYVPTHYFYLPINKMTELFNQKFTLKVTSFGYNQTSFNWDLRYLNNRGLVGDCHNSDYCVRGEVS